MAKKHNSPVPTLQGPCGWSPKRRGSLSFLSPLEMRPSSIAPSPAESREAPPTPQHPSPIRGTMGSSLRSLAEVEGNEAFPPQPQKDLECPSSTRLEALVPHPTKTCPYTSVSWLQATKGVFLHSPQQSSHLHSKTGKILKKELFKDQISLHSSTPSSV